MDFRDQTIYFIVTDRFFDGDPENNTGKSSESFDKNKKDWYMYWGGDLSGIIKKLDYLKEIGVSAIWITPVFEQIDGIVDASGKKMSPYHGYWAKDFKRIDEHLVDHHDDTRVFLKNDTIFDKLIKELHKRDMKLILDIVCNHSNPNFAGGRGELYDDGVKIASYDDDKGGWYHHGGEVSNWSDLSEVQERTFCGLSDFDEDTFAFRDYIKSAIKMWLDKGIDGLRVDTVKHMPLWFWQEFTGDILKYKPDIFIFGEWFQGGVYDLHSVEFAAKSGMSIIDFSLRQAIENVLARDCYRGFPEIEDIIKEDGFFKTATELVTFIDNHDMPRFLSVKNDPDRLRIALDFIMTARGIPCLYYGSEQYLHNDTAGGNDPYNRPMMELWDKDTPIARDMKNLARLRKENPAIQKGSMLTKYISPDIYVFSREYMGNYCLVAINKSDHKEIQVNNINLPNGEYEDIIGGEKINVRNGEALIELPVNSVRVFSKIVPPVEGKSVITFQINGYSTRYGEEIYLTGDCPELGNWDISKAKKLNYINFNTWCGDIAFNESCGKFIRYKFAIISYKSVKRENGLGHYRLVPKKDRENWKDDWQN